jgi:hypothetical protein
MFWRLFLLALWLPWPALAQDAVLPEGSEAAVLAWLQPLAMDKPVTADWTLRDVGLDRGHLLLTLQGPGAQTLQATVVYPGVLQCPEAQQKAVCQALQDALAQQPRAPSPWLVVEPAGEGKREIERAGLQFPEHDTTRPARWTLLAVWLALLVGLLQVLWQLARKSPAPLWFWPLTVTMLGLAVRLSLAPRGLQHEMFHADESLGFLAGASHFANGEAVPALVNALNLVFHGADQTLYTLTLVAAVLAMPAIIWFAVELTGHWRVAVLAGLLLAIAPAHIHFSASEEFGIDGVTLALLSWAAWLRWLRDRSGLLLLIATTSGVLAMQTRPEFALLPLMHLTLMIAVLPLRALPAVGLRKELWLALVLAALACWHVPLDIQMRGGFPGFSPLAVQNIVPRLIWLDPQLSIWPVLLWLVPAVLFGLFSRRGWWLVAWALGLAVLLLGLYVADGAYAWRMQLVPEVLTCVLAAWMVGVLPRLLLIPSLLVLVLASVQLASAARFIRQPGLTERQYRFEMQHVRDLPPHAEILAVLSAQIDHPPRFGHLQPAETRILRDAADLQHLPPPGPNQVFLQSAACWVRWPADKQDLRDMQPVCRAVHEKYRLEPIAEMDLPPTREPPLAWAPVPGPNGYRIGYYRLLAR